MNTDQIKSKLLRLDRNVPDFTVILSGKKSVRVDGLYKPESREIIIHNRNFSNERELVHTAIHEFAHHIQFSRTTKPISGRSHTSGFWNIFHSLLASAESLGFYENVFTKNEEFIELTKKIRTDFIEKNGTIIKDLGKILLRAKTLCDKYHASFYDYVECALGLPRSDANSMMRVYTSGVNPKIGYEQMKTVSKIQDPDQRNEAEKAILRGTSPYIIKSDYFPNQKESADPVEALKREEAELRKRIKSLQEKLNAIRKKIENIEHA